MKIRDRIRELRRVKARTLVPNPKNWRVHPENQKNALRGVLAEVGYADALLARELPDGSLMLLDGHLRAETTPEQEVPVLVLDVTEEEADKLLVVIDPLSSMAQQDSTQLNSLLERMETQNESMRNLLDSILEKNTELLNQSLHLDEMDLDISADSLNDDQGHNKDLEDKKYDGCGNKSTDRPAVDVPTLYQVLVECHDEQNQREIYERMQREGLKCKLIYL